ncbi:MAG TPA: 3-methyl-2-oxobutanoate hydroxymethyltransferase [Bryobacteraceae bacterium]|jgi:3-methyl-2-oxobutanoate hydroxymethyltransferase|nr:3-methyl-2-oxobutanoate hydroxymethyltransferase [Bryobacteraceae bacterium]
MLTNSFPPPIAISAPSEPARSARDFPRAKLEGRKLSMVTCYDYSFARLLATSAVDGILVGDSVAMVIHGHPSTVTASLEMMRLHTEAVARGAGGKFIVADMPFLSFRKGVAAALDAAHVLMGAGANAVKLEGVDGHEDVVERMVQSGIPVMGHVGLQPQSVQAYGGYRVQGRSDDTAREIARHARALEQLGAFAVVLECIPAKLAGEITAALRIPTIGIGAGADCDGQILVLQDLLGMNTGHRPRFARTFSDGAHAVMEAVANFDDAVKAGTFPAVEESY